jgi:hypothetical protein
MSSLKIGLHFYFFLKAVRLEYEQSLNNHMAIEQVDEDV